MLSKLMKYEIKATARVFLPLYALIIPMSLLTKVFLHTTADTFEIPRMITMSVYVILMVALFVMTLIVTIQRFYRNLLGDEGYLSFTLPVKTHTHIDAKLLVTLIWVLLSSLIAALSIFILAADGNTFAQIRRVWVLEFVPFLAKYGTEFWIAALEGIVLVVVSTLCQTAEIYTAITVGNLSSKHKLIAGIGAYIGFGIVMQTIASIFVSMFKPFFENYFTATNPDFPFPAINFMLLIILLMQLIYLGVFYFVTDWLLSRKLNLE